MRKINEELINNDIFYLPYDNVNTNKTVDYLEINLSPDLREKLFNIIDDKISKVFTVFI
ncbi:hypothetical protein EDD66_10987 [Mobilisporobacter senegalensis]|uniref:Uncharacterized protein n=1 Tax=Mobilisporobacter senegalensis TaxID=1329262 RepID=A0A3N1XME2_9FIRM|nr:hypothetical protein [Mobilisporobacter senegalensis]ROR25877.1 hypothetical protein EDD66_10987 [Mobilisporobacter senegalensis]